MVDDLDLDMFGNPRKYDKYGHCLFHPDEITKAFGGDLPSIYDDGEVQAKMWLSIIGILVVIFLIYCPAFALLAFSPIRGLMHL